MITASNLAGFHAAHAIWNISDNDGLIPWIAYTTESGEQKMERYATGDPSEAVEQARKAIDDNEMDYTDAVLVYDGRITVKEEKMDAIIIELFAAFSPGSKVAMAVPYSPASTGKFTVYRPKILTWEECEDFEMEDVVNSFFEGVDSHAEGSNVWNAHLDQSK